MTVDAGRAVREILVDVAFLGRTRDVDGSDRLSRVGGGLDSLALVEFLSAVETAFELDLPEAMWTGEDGATLDDLVAFVATHSTVPTEPAPSAASGSPSDAWTVKVQRTLRDRGWVRGSTSLAMRALRRAVRPAYQFLGWVVLSRDLGSDIPSPPLPDGIVMRDGRPSDGPSLESWRPARQRSGLLTLFDERLEAGFHCLTAWRGEELVALDWIVPTTYTDPISGLRLETEADSCLGLDLREHSDYMNRGVGLALLAHSLLAAQRLGFSRQVTLVRTDNLRMLTAARQILGFHAVGGVATHRLAGRPVSRWTVNSRSGWGPLRL